MQVLSWGEAAVRAPGRSLCPLCEDPGLTAWVPFPAPQQWGRGGLLPSAHFHVILVGKLVNNPRGKQFKKTYQNCTHVYLRS